MACITRLCLYHRLRSCTAPQQRPLKLIAASHTWTVRVFHETCLSPSHVPLAPPPRRCIITRTCVFHWSRYGIRSSENGGRGTGMNVPGGSGEVVVRLGKAADGSQLLLSPDLDHISLWCEDFAVDFGNAALECDGAAPGPGPADVAPLPAPLAAAVPTDVADAPGPIDSVTPDPVSVPVATAPVAADPVDGPIAVEPAMAPPAPAPAAATPEVGGPGEVEGDNETADLGVGGDEAADAESSEGASADGAAVEADGAAAVAKFVSAGALAAGAAVLLL